MSLILRAAIITILFAITICNASAKYSEVYYVNGQLAAQGTHADSAATAQTSSFSVATFNAGILYKFKKRSFEPTPFTDERLHLIPNGLMNTTADVVCIQEVYNEADKQVVIQGVKDVYPYAVYYQKKRKGGAGWHSGLLILSKFPISASSFELYKRNALMEKVFADKGVLCALIDLNGTDIAIANTHTTVGGGVFNTESDRVNRFRNHQVIQALMSARAFGTDNYMVLGDFNAGPGVSEVNYQTLLDSLMIDSYTAIERLDSTEIYTWHPENPLNADGFFTTSPPQRIDNVFISPQMAQQFTVTHINTILTEGVLTKDSIGYPVSDHYGYQVTFQVK